MLDEPEATDAGHNCKRCNPSQPRASSHAFHMDELRIETTPAFADIQFLDVRAYREALATRDVTTLDDIWADDYTFTNPHGALLTKKQRLENIRSGHTQIESVASEDEDVRVYGDTAVITARITLKGKYSGKESSGQYRSISVWVNQQGRWRLVANQLTLIAKH